MRCVSTFIETIFYFNLENIGENYCSYYLPSAILGAEMDTCRTVSLEIGAIDSRMAEEKSMTLVAI